MKKYKLTQRLLSLLALVLILVPMMSLAVYASAVTSFGFGYSDEKGGTSYQTGVKTTSGNATLTVTGGYWDEGSTRMWIADKDFYSATNSVTVKSTGTWPLTYGSGYSSYIGRVYLGCEATKKVQGVYGTFTP